jgi:hypothetical protein
MEGSSKGCASGAGATSFEQNHINFVDMGVNTDRVTAAVDR